MKPYHLCLLAVLLLVAWPYGGRLPEAMMVAAGTQL